MRLVRPSSRRGSGFSLLEVMIAMLILSVGAAAILSLFAAAASTHRKAVDRTRAALVAERVLGEARFLYTPGKEPGTLGDDLRKRLPEEIDGYLHEALFFRPEGEDWKPDELVARIVIRWRQSGAERSELFHTVLLPRHRLGDLPAEEPRARKRR